MLQNSRLLYDSQMAAKQANSTPIFVIHNLLKEVEHHKKQLSLALTINSMLVQEATYHTLLPNPSIFNETLPQSQYSSSNQIKMEYKEEEPDSPSVHLKRTRKTPTKSNDQEDGDQNHDKNQTKNIPKNYGKAMLSFIQKNIQKYLTIIKPILSKGKLSVVDLLAHIKKHKKEVNSINYLKEMWGYQDQSNPILKCIRILSFVFMRKHCLSYIFNSRVKNYSTHIKYRTRVIEGIQHPEEFTCIKQF